MDDTLTLRIMKLPPSATAWRPDWGIFAFGLRHIVTITKWGIGGQRE